MLSSQDVNYCTALIWVLRWCLMGKPKNAQLEYKGPIWTFECKEGNSQNKTKKQTLVCVFMRKKKKKSLLRFISLFLTVPAGKRKFSKWNWTKGNFLGVLETCKLQNSSVFISPFLFNQVFLNVFILRLNKNREQRVKIAVGLFLL